MALAVQISSYEELEKVIQDSEKEYDQERIRAAYQLAVEKHGDQKRSSGEPYIIHPLSVAAILVGLGMDSESVMAGLLHDVVEDTDCTVEELTQKFGKEVALLVDGVTKLGKIPYSSREEQQAENLRKMLMAMAEDIRVIIIKFADRMHNLATLEYVSPQKQRDKALECLEVYAPIAHRLGIRTVKEFMEDVSLKYLDPQAYQEIEEDLASRSKSSKQFIEETKEMIRARLAPVVPDVYIEGRVKSVYGIYRKMFIQGKSFEEIYDVFAVRVIVDTIGDCFNVLGIIHDMFQPLPGRFKDYISMPKPNMYQSLHTTVITKAGVPFEVQIRTWEMHHTAEYGIAAHWKYKLGMSAKESDNAALDERLSWIRQMLENQAESEDVTDLVHSIKSDLIPEEVFVFTPQGGRGEPAPGLHGHRLRLCHPLGGGQPDDRRQGGQAHRAPGLQGKDRGDHRDPHHQGGGQGPQPGLAHPGAHQRGQEQDPGLVQEGEAGREHHRGQGRAGAGVPPQQHGHGARADGLYAGERGQAPQLQQRGRLLRRHRLWGHPAVEGDAPYPGGVPAADQGRRAPGTAPPPRRRRSTGPRRPAACW